jgi:Sulfate permease family
VHLRLGEAEGWGRQPRFKAGIGVVIVVDQIPKVLGIHFIKGSFLHNVASIGLGLPHVAIPTLAIGVFAIAGLAVIEKLRPRWPAPLIIVAAAIAAVGAFALQGFGVSLVGTLWLAGLAPDVYGMIQRSPLGEALGRERLFFNVELAVDKYRAQQEPAASHAGWRARRADVGRRPASAYSRRSERRPLRLTWAWCR